VKREEERSLSVPGSVSCGAIVGCHVRVRSPMSPANPNHMPFFSLSLSLSLSPFNPNPSLKDLTFLSLYL
jgi:hypothetical protein